MVHSNSCETNVSNADSLLSDKKQLSKQAINIECVKL